MLKIVEYTKSPDSVNKKICRVGINCKLQTAHQRSPGDIIQLVPIRTRQDRELLYEAYNKNIDQLDDENKDLRNIQLFRERYPSIFNDSSPNHVHVAITELQKHNIFLSQDELDKLLMPIRPRRFASGSFSFSHPDYIELFINAETFCILDHEFHGLTVDNIFNGTKLLEGDVLPYRSRLPNPFQPLAMICVFTGIAPCRSIWQHREALGCKPCSLLISQTVEPWGSMLDDEISRLRIPRQTASSLQNIYSIISTSRQLAEIINNEGNIFVCGLNQQTILKALAQNPHIEKTFAKERICPHHSITLESRLYT